MHKAKSPKDTSYVAFNSSFAHNLVCATASEVA